MRKFLKYLLAVTVLLFFVFFVYTLPEWARTTIAQFFFVFGFVYAIGAASDYFGRLTSDLAYVKDRLDQIEADITLHLVELNQVAERIENAVNPYNEKDYYE